MSKPIVPDAGRHTASRLAFMWLAGFDLRVTVLAVPPLLPIIRAQLGMDEKGVALLASLPVLLLGLAAIPGSLLVARLGARLVLLVGLLLIAVGTAMRGVGSTTAVLLLMTFVMGVGIAISQPTMPALVRQWFPDRITRATGVWTGGLLVGEFVGAAATLVLVYPLVGGQWQLALAFWAIPVVFTIALMVLTEFRREPPAPEPGRGPVNGWPDWRRANVWQLGLLQSSTSLIYFGANTFLPDYLHTHNQTELIGPALTILNFSQIPASFVVGLLPWRILSHNGFLLSLSALVLAGLPGLLSDQPAAVLSAAALLGFSSACVLVVVLALPALLAHAQDVARLSAGSATIGYLVAFTTNLIAGAVWDSTHIAATGFLPVLAGAALILLLGPRLVRSAVAARTADR